MSNKKLTLSNDKKLLGVCAGIAEYLEVDPTVIRVLFVIFSFAFGTGLLVYLALYLIMPAAVNNRID